MCSISGMWRNKPKKHRWDVLDNKKKFLGGMPTSILIIIFGPNNVI